MLRLSFFERGTSRTGGGGGIDRCWGDVYDVGEDAISPLAGLELTTGLAIVELGNSKPIPKVGAVAALDLVIGSVINISIGLKDK